MPKSFISTMSTDSLLVNRSQEIQNVLHNNIANKGWVRSADSICIINFSMLKYAIQDISLL